MKVQAVMLVLEDGTRGVFFGLPFVTEKNEGVVAEDFLISDVMEVDSVSPFQDVLAKLDYAFSQVPLDDFEGDGEPEVVH